MRWTRQAAFAQAIFKEGCLLASLYWWLTTVAAELLDIQWCNATSKGFHYLKSFKSRYRLPDPAITQGVQTRSNRRISHRQTCKHRSDQRQRQELEARHASVPSAQSPASCAGTSPLALSQHTVLCVHSASPITASSIQLCDLSTDWQNLTLCFIHCASGNRCNTWLLYMGSAIIIAIIYSNQVLQSSWLWQSASQLPVVAWMGG